MHIDRILKLARLKIDKKEKENLEKDFSSILNFVKKIEKLNTNNIKPMSYPIEVYNEMREDKIRKLKIKNDKKNLVETAPEKKDGFIKVKNVLK